MPAESASTATICHSGSSGNASLNSSAPPYSAPAVSTTTFRNTVNPEKASRERRS